MADESVPVGIIGIHIHRMVFRQMIEPLTRLSEQSKRSVHPSFWVYSENQLEGIHWDKYDEPIYKLTAKESIKMTEQAMKQLILSLFKYEVQ